MVKRISCRRRLSDRISDWIWPHLTGDAESPPQGEDYFRTGSAVDFDDVNSVVLSRLAQAEERVRTVESKLMALLTLASVLSVAVTASLAAVTTLGKVDEDAEIYARFAMVLVIFYVALQLLCSLRATVAGLKRKAYWQLSPEDMVPKDIEISETYRIRLLNLQVDHMLYNESVVNDKVGQMAVAHAALKNALTATFALVVLAFLFASFQFAMVLIQ